MFGGNVPQLDNNDPATYEWDGSRWSVKNQVGPFPRWGHQMAYDTNASRTILYGGMHANLFYTLSDTWTWDGSAWVQAGAGLPPGRTHGAMVFDSWRNETILYGGGNLGDTWTHVLNATGPTVLQAPVDWTANAGTSMNFVVEAAGTGALQYQWRFLGAPLDDQPPYSGVTTPTLTIDPVTPEIWGWYDVVVTDSTCAVASTAAWLFVIECPGDLSPATGGNGFINQNDLASLVDEWGACELNCPADIHPVEAPNGIVGPGDLAVLLANWGQCP